MLIKKRLDDVYLEPRLECFRELIEKCRFDFVIKYGSENYFYSNLYLTAKVMYVTPSNNSNREGYHSDGFKTDDINYIWSDSTPTVFNTSAFNISQDEQLSLQEMQEQALTCNEVTYPNNTILRLNQFNIHKCGTVKDSGVRTFIKLSFSKDEYDLEYNTHNYLIDYTRGARKRSNHRNVPQKT